MRWPGERAARAGLVACVVGTLALAARAADPAQSPPTAKVAVPDSELLLTLSIELSNEPGNATTVAGRAVRTNWQRVGDVSEGSARIGNLRKELVLRYAMPTDLAGFSSVSHEVQGTDIRQYLTESTLFGFREALYRNLWFRPAPLGSWGLGWGVETVRLDAVEGVAPFLVEYVQRQGRTTTAVPLIAFWSYDSRVAGSALPSGTFASLLGEWGTAAGSIEYARFDASYQSHLPIGSRFAGSLGLAVGRVVGLGHDLSPYNKRFLGGGVGSVRGYEPGALSPQDASGATGADTKVTLALEGHWHAMDVGNTPVVLSLFYDRGWFRGSEGAVADSAVAGAYGLGITLPIRGGLVRVFFSRPHDEGFRTQEFQFEARASW
jgi:outer membrane protein assembly factor BamA